MQLWTRSGRHRSSVKSTELPLSSSSENRSGFPSSSASLQCNQVDFPSRICLLSPARVAVCCVQIHFSDEPGDRPGFFCTAHQKEQGQKSRVFGQAASWEKAAKFVVQFPSLSLKLLGGEKRMSARLNGAKEFNENVARNRWRVKAGFSSSII